MTIDPQTMAAVTEAVARAMTEEYGSPAGAEAVAEAALAAILPAEVEHATLYTLSLDVVNREEARFAAAGGFTLMMHRGEWMERGRPARIWISVEEALEPSAAS